jgi:hypothetical protein
MHMHIMPPHIIMQGMPMPIMDIMLSQQALNIAICAGSIGIIFIIMAPSGPISQDMRHIIMGIGIMPDMPGMPPIMEFIMPFIIGIIMGMPIWGIPIWGIMPPIMGMAVAVFIMALSGVGSMSVFDGPALGPESRPAQPIASPAQHFPPP